MQSDCINIGLAFIEGFALIISPCILPILPIILSASIEGSRKRPYGIILGFVLSFALFTFFSRNLVLWFGFNLDIIRNLSFVLLILFGLVMISSYLTEKFNNLTQGFANLGFRATAHDTQRGFTSGIVFGALVGLIWTPCAGPILAAVIVQSLLQHSSISSFLIIVAFAIGAGLPMLIISIFGRQITSKVNFFKSHAIILRKTLGVIIILAVILMAFGGKLFMPTTSYSSDSTLTADHLISGLNNPYPAPELRDITAWINTAPLQISELKGKVVLIDFWAYSCINCIRTLPYLVDWYHKYSNQGLVIIGVHSPEFDFERDVSNVRKATQQDGILYPVALDNNFATWKNYENQFWPAHYLIDKNGNVVYTHFGEGDYNITESNIRYLLGINTPSQATKPSDQQFASETPETYLGYDRSAAYSGIEQLLHDKPAMYSYPTQLAKNHWALHGSWIIGLQKIISSDVNAAIKINFKARKVFAVMGNASKTPIKVNVLLNGQPHGAVAVNGYNLYTTLTLESTDNGVLELVATDPGLEIYTFTFGS